jgi:hypothetical protein
MQQVCDLSPGKNARAIKRMIELIAIPEQINQQERNDAKERAFAR